MSNGMDADNESQISLTRTIAAHVSDVFKAWTDPALIEQWEADEAEFDAFEGVKQIWSTPLIYAGRIYAKGERELVCFELPK